MPTVDASEPVSESRAARRAAREERRRNPILPPMATERRFTVVVATAVLAALLAVGTVADHAHGAAAVAWLGLALAWGWPELLGSTSRFGSSFAIGIAGVLGPVTVALTPDEPFLRHVPVVVAASVLAMFLHQLVRKDGRPRLTQSVAAGAAGIAIAAIGVGWVPLGRTSGGTEVVVVAAIALAVSAAADLAAGLDRVRPWMVGIAIALGFLAGGISGLVVDEVGVLAGVVVGAVAGGVAHVMRRVLCVLPPIRGLRGQITAAAASVLVTGVPVGVLAAIFVG